MTEKSYWIWNDHACQLVSTFHSMLDRKLFVDVTLVTEEGLFLKVHRIILCAASRYFENLLSQQPEDTHITVILSGIDFEHLRVLVEFIYKGSATVSRSQLPSLLELASSLEIKGIGIDCQQRNEFPSTSQAKSDGTFLEIVPNSVKSITEMPSHSEKPLSLEHNDLFVKEEVDYDSDATDVYEPEEHNLLISESGSTVTELLPVSLSNSSTTDSPEKKSGRSSRKRKKSHQHHSSSKSDFSTRSAVSKRKSSLNDQEGSSRKRSLNPITLIQQEETQVAPDFTIIGDETFPAPLAFKRDPYTREEEKWHEKMSDQNGMQCEELVEKDFGGDATSQISSSEDSSAESSDEDYDIATCSTNAPKKNEFESTKKAKSLTERKQTGSSSFPGTIPAKSFKCDTCERVFKYKKNRDAHLKYKCRKEPSFSCTLCTYRTGTKSHLKRHLVTVHNVKDSDLAAHGLGPTIRSELPFKCNKCPRSFKNKDGLRNHLKRCGVDPAFPCTLCDHQSKRKEDLRNHLTGVHGIGPADFAAHGVDYYHAFKRLPS